MTDYAFASASELSRALRDKDVSAKELATFFLARAERASHLNAFTVLCHETALQRAEASDARRARGETLGPADGLPVAIKDLFCTEGVSSTACSRVLQGFVPPYESTVSDKLRRAGAVMLGKTNMDEFAMGSSNANSSYGPCFNPWRDPSDGSLSLTPGGSSGGSASAVAAGLAPLATGSDTGGSIRQPASFCGLVGVKPTYGRCSRYGMIAYASSLDQAGMFARNVADAAFGLSLIAGHDPKDATSAPLPAEDFAAAVGSSLKGKRVGVPKEYRIPGMPEDVRRAWDNAAARLEEAGAEIVEISLPHTDYGLAAYYIIACAEASANLARYDGVRYGKRPAEEVASLDALYAKTRAEGFGAEVKRRIMLGAYVLSAGYYDAYYDRAQRVRALTARDFKEAFEHVDLILTPATPGPAFRMDAAPTDPTVMYMNDVFTVPVSLAGLPSLALPAGFSDSGLPLGVQLVAPHFKEAELFAFAAALEARLRLTVRPPEL